MLVTMCLKPCVSSASKHCLENMFRFLQFSFFENGTGMRAWGHCQGSWSIVRTSVFFICLQVHNQLAHHLIEICLFFKLSHMLVSFVPPSLILIITLQIQHGRIPCLVSLYQMSFSLNLTSPLYCWISGHLFHRNLPWLTLPPTVR